jgi:phosphotransferase system IIA component
VADEIITLKEEITVKINDLLTECDDTTIHEKLKQTNNMVIETQTNKYNLFKLRELKNDL